MLNYRPLKPKKVRKNKLRLLQVKKIVISTAHDSLQNAVVYRTETGNYFLQYTEKHGKATTITYKYSITKEEYTQLSKSSLQLPQSWGRHIPLYLENNFNFYI